ncbi:MAG: insulinase family protein [Bacteroidales bacterium]|jgi:hypothetical protein|nr:insulinase family protein [Bacteroidales bacterium]MCI1784953.1 insulinase family protein [Bacteroidales bacterium]
MGKVLMIPYNLFVGLVALLIPVVMPAQGIVSLKPASEITSGSLPNGVLYYMVANGEHKGFADVALVRKQGNNGQAREDLSELPHFENYAPYKFMADKGVDYGPKGYVSYDSVSTVFHFRDVPLSVKNVADSTIMMLSDIVASSQSDQAIIIAGDFDKAAILEKLDLFAMTIPHRLGQNDCLYYKWMPSDSAKMKIEYNRQEGDVSSVSVEYSLPRVPEKYMNTIQPLVSRMFISELASVVSDRLYRKLRLEGIPVADAVSNYKSSSDGPGDETISFNLHTDSSHIYGAAKVLGSVLASVDSKGISTEEYKDAKNKFVSDVVKTGNVPLSNSYYIKKCSAAFLYGAGLSSIEAQTDFFLTRNLPDTTELRLFNHFVSVLLDKDKNLSLRVKTSRGVSGDSLMTSFRSSWAKQVSDDTDYMHLMNFGDTLGLAGRQSRVRLRNIKSESASGGELWTFSNGIKVVYKKMSTPGLFDYALMIRGGYNDIAGLKPGEGAFVSDMLGLYDISGLKYYDFADMLESNGISMHYNVSVSDMRITGRTSSSKLGLLLRSLLSIANERSLDEDAFGYYKGNELMRLEMGKGNTEEKRAVIDTLLHSGYAYTRGKIAGSLEDSLLYKADDYFNNQFSKVNDGVIVLAGDLDPVRMKKILYRYLGGFHTEKTIPVSIPKQYRPGSGSLTYTVKGDDKGIDIAMSSPMQYSSDNYFAAMVAGYAIRKALITGLADSGMYAEEAGDFYSLPQDSFNYYISCEPVDSMGLPASVKPGDAISVLYTLRTILNGLSGNPLPVDEISGYKSSITNCITSYSSVPEFVINSVLMKYSEGKDLFGKYKDKLSAVNPDKVREIIASLNNGRKVEYIMK